MGIRGLTTFITANPEFLKPHKLHDSYVVIDGDNLIYPLYFNYNINVICGGDYNKYAEFVRDYFSKFLECKIQPIIAFDGGCDKSDRKMKTIFKNMYDRLSSVKSIAQNKSKNKRVLPILARNVVRYVLDELNIPFVLCDYEADDQIAALANYYKCPVISADSDFFITDLCGGFIPLYSIEEVINFEKEYRYLNCDIYYVDEFLSHFPGIEKSILPLFGTLMGNDYVEEDEFYNFFSNIQLLKGEKTTGLLNWLKNKSLNEAVTEILQNLSEDRQEYVKTVIDYVTEGYNLDNCNLQDIINQKLNISQHKIKFVSGLITPCGSSLPFEFIVKYHSGQYSSSFPNIIVLHKYFLTPQIDDLSSCSSFMCARYIRRVIYGILIRHDVDGTVCQNKNCLAPIEEYDRHEDRYDKEVVEPIFALHGIGELPNINQLHSLRKIKAMAIITEILGIELDFVRNLPDEWQLLIGCINYCLFHCVPHFTEEFLYALILNLIYCDIIRYNGPNQNASVCYKSAKFNHICSSIPCIMSKVNESELLRAMKEFKTYLGKPRINYNNPLCVKIVHSYSQLQSCLSAVVDLNNVLGKCMKNPDIHKYFNGSFLYNLTKDISTWSKPKLYVSGILGRKTNLFAIFELLESKVCQYIPNHYILKNSFCY